MDLEQWDGKSVHAGDLLGALRDGIVGMSNSYTVASTSNSQCEHSKLLLGSATCLHDRCRPSMALLPGFRPLRHSLVTHSCQGSASSSGGFQNRTGENSIEGQPVICNIVNRVLASVHRTRTPYPCHLLEQYTDISSILPELAVSQE